MVLLGDEVWGNLETTGDGHIGGEKFLCYKGYIIIRKSTRKEKYFTVIGLTILPGEPICCILIIEGKKIYFIFGLVLIYLRRKLDIKVMEKNHFAWV